MTDGACKPLLRRIGPSTGAPIGFTLNGAACQGREGDTVLTALLTLTDALRQSPFSGAPRAGFCLMGACQDCWVRLQGGGSLRACSTLLRPGMAFELPATGEAAR